MRARSARLAACLAAVALGAGLVAGCGGDDEEPAAATTVTEQVTVVTDAAPETVPAESVPEVIPDGAPEGGEDGSSGTRPSDAEIEEAVRAYQQIVGFSEEQSRCLIEASIELSGSLDPDDPAAVLGSGALEVFERCNIDLAELAGRLGGTP